MKIINLVLICTLVDRIMSAEPVFENSVMVLDESNFDETIKKYPMIVVEFYAPWCPHCKALAPDWSKAANQLLSHNPPLPMAKVDATTQPNLNKRFITYGFPTIICFTYSGTVQKEYT